MTLRISEDEFARDVHAVLARVRRDGVGVVVMDDQRPMAVIRTPEGPGRRLSECLALAQAYERKLGYAPVPDPDFGADVQSFFGW